MMLKKNFHILYWILAVLLAVVYLGVKRTALESSNLDLKSISYDVKIQHKDILSEFAHDESKLLVDEQKSIDALADIFEHSLSKAVTDSLGRMKTPVDDLTKAIRELIALESKVIYSPHEIKKINRITVDAFSAMQYLQVNGRVLGKNDIQKICLSDRSLSSFYNRAMCVLEVKENINSIKEFVLYAILCSDDPYKTLGQIVKNKTIQVHNNSETFLIKEFIYTSIDSMDVIKQYEVNRFINQPRWNLWAPAFRVNSGFLGKIFNMVGVGGTIDDVVLETRSSNIVRANIMLKKYMKEMTIV